MRGKKAIVNTFCAFLQETIAVIGAFILPRLILSHFGSASNGLVQSITQFLGYMTILRFGLGGATRAALYKPIAEGDETRVNAIMHATQLYMKRMTAVISVCIIVAAALFPFVTKGQFGWLYSFSLFLIIGLVTIADTLFGISNLILLQADQRLYVSSLSRIVATIVNIVVVVLLVKYTASLHIVELGSVLSICIYPLLMKAYVDRRYNINYNTEPDFRAIKGIRYTFYHQVAQFVMGNTDIVVISIFLSMTEVSVYSVYNLVATGIQKVVMNFTNGMEAAFGNMLAKKENSLLKENFRIIEVLIFNVATVTYTTAYLMILPFVRLYTSGITDAVYIRPLFALFLMVAQYFLCIRQPYRLLVQASGAYKETRYGAILEPIINIVISVVAILKFGITGVLFGTLVSAIFRTVDLSIYVNKNIVPGTVMYMIKLLVCSFAQITIILLFNNQIINQFEISNYFHWCEISVVMVLISIVVVFLFSYCFFNAETKSLIKKIKNIGMKVLE